MQNPAKTSKKLARKSRGQGMTEYIIVVALIAIAAIGVISLFGDNLRKLFGASSQALSGNEAVDPGTKDVKAKEHKDLKTFGQQGGEY